MKTTGVVICNYNKADKAIRCIKSVFESVSDDFDLYVVDNASEDDSAARIRELFHDRLELIINDCNLGGSGGFDAGISRAVEAGHKYVWCLDNDSIADEHALDTLVSFMDSHPEVGMTGSKILNMSDPGLIQQYGMTVDNDAFCIEANYLNCADDDTVPSVVYSDAVAACSVLVRSSLIKKIGMLPEENFLYWDDTEWGIRCNKAGYKVASLGSSLVEHEMGAHDESSNLLVTYYAWRNWIHFFICHTTADRLEKMAQTFLSSIFRVLYEGIYNKHTNKAKTVMFAYDDAIHSHLGKIDENKILPPDSTDDQRLRRLAEKYDVIHITTNGKDSLCANISSQLKKIKSSVDIKLDNDFIEINSSGKYCMVTLCDSIFSQMDTSLKTVYIDTDENVLADENDALMIINYDYSFETFYQSQLAIFLSCAEKIRLNEG